MRCLGSQRLKTHHSPCECFDSKTCKTHLLTSSRFKGPAANFLPLLEHNFHGHEYLGTRPHQTFQSIGGTSWDPLRLTESSSFLTPEDVEMTIESNPHILYNHAYRTCREHTTSTASSGIQDASSFGLQSTTVPSALTIPSMSRHESGLSTQARRRQSFAEEGLASHRSSLGTSALNSLSLDELLQDWTVPKDDIAIGEQDQDTCCEDDLSRANPIVIPNANVARADHASLPLWNNEGLQCTDYTGLSIPMGYSGSLQSQSSLASQDNSVYSFTSGNFVSALDPSMASPYSQPFDPVGSLDQHERGVLDMGSSQRHDVELSSTYPPTEGFWPPGMEHARFGGRCSVSPKTSRASLRPHSSSLKHRPVKGGSIQRDRSTNDRLRPSIPERDLSVVFEHCNFTGSQAVPKANPGRGGRRGPLTAIIREKASLNRRERRVCIRCKKLKVGCSGGNPCDECQKNSNAAPWGICTPFFFLPIVESGSLNYISQYSVNHLILNGQRRVVLCLPEVFDIDELSLSTSTHGRLYNILVRQAATPLYTLHLEKFFRFLSALRRRRSSGTINVRELVDTVLPKTRGGLNCISTRVIEAELLPAQACWNNMPSRLTYEVVDKGSGDARMLNVEDSSDQDIIRMAARLSKIVSRTLEVEAFAYLQKQLGDLVIRESCSGVDIERLLDSLGKILLPLRWRRAWWKCFGGSACNDGLRDRFVDRVDSLLRILYFYYVYAYQKLPSGVDPRSFEGVRSVYADARPVYEEFPRDGSLNGFQAWLDYGEKVIELAGVVDFLSRYQA